MKSKYCCGRKLKKHLSASEKKNKGEVKIRKSFTWRCKTCKLCCVIETDQRATMNIYGFVNAFECIFNLCDAPEWEREIAGKETERDYHKITTNIFKGIYCFFSILVITSIVVGFGSVFYGAFLGGMEFADYDHYVKHCKIAGYVMFSSLGTFCVSLFLSRKALSIAESDAD